ncbi:Ribokinase-like protein [Cokeromyces recurvatus]|uniref:Ribokinase-like protein n=1 Tax=Cokeromyces recurvatus TaxID=90255 RepID=UPI00221F722F|nr:Ribokinase-like protein [Cokeromyces recurvatus]KAI7900028.1 Ribokinase-like protein [Cokeromyces recurvatus]
MSSIPTNDPFNEKCKSCILLVGQLYLDYILHVNEFPKEDLKVRANYAEQRTGGNTCNTAKVLVQFQKQNNIYYMSAVGSRETSGHIIEALRHQSIQTDDTIIYRHDKITPSSTIIHSEKTGSRTIISNHQLESITFKEFVQLFEKIYQRSSSWWVHFEGRNIAETLQQIDWLNEKAISENWRHQLTISVEAEKPERADMEQLIRRGDVVFLSKVFAQHHNHHSSKSFLTESTLLQQNLKSNAKAFCTWGSEEASALDNETNQIFQYSPLSIEKAVDSVGAGDTFNAGVIHYLSSSSQQSLGNALEFACNLATKKVSQQGFDGLK